MSLLLAVTTLAFATATAQVTAPAVDSPQAKTAARDAATLKQFPPPGRLIDIGGRRLQVFCEGPAEGPTVILEPGAGASSLYYRDVQDRIAKIARVCSYDRAGLGWSDPATYPRSLEDRADDLDALLRTAQIKGPYILVGHSMGGLLVRIYAHKHANNLAGMVLVESSEENFNGNPQNVAQVKALVPLLGGAVQAAEAGIDVPQMRLPNGPPNQAVALRASVYRSAQDDMAALADIPAEFVRLGPLAPLGDIPLVVITRGKRDPAMSDTDVAGWEAAHARLATLSTRSIRITAERSSHAVQIDQPEIFAEAVQRVLAMRK